MKNIALAIAILASGFIFAQEKISPLQINQTIYEQPVQTRASGVTTIDSTFIYEFSTLPLSNVWDDFSSDKFEQFDAEPLDGGVTSVLYYRLMDLTNTTPLDPTLIFCDSAYAYHDTVKIDEIGAVLETVRNYPFTPFDIWVNNLCEYPVEGVLNEGVFQECYALIDSIIDGVLDLDQDTVWYNMDPTAYVQDSARVFTKVVTDPNTLWEDNFACHNYTYATNPWSLGVATFDGLDENGYPYAIGDDGAHGVADYLTSRPIDLSTPGPGEIVYLTMIYQAEGFGNMPEGFDSLVLEMYSPDLDGWYHEWSVSGDDVVADSWDTLYFPVPVGYYEDGFQFRFKNYASLSGALDHWHIDYLKLSVEPFVFIESFNDVAIQYPINTILKDYTRVPWDHYVANTAGSEHMLEDIVLRTFNSTTSATNFTNGEWEVRYGGILQGGSPFNIPVSASPSTNFDVGLTPLTFDGAADFSYDPGLGGTQAAFDLKFGFTSAAGPDKNVYKENDTTYFTQRFDNYYAYDDGSAEAAYGIEGEGSLMAYKFEAYEAGRLKGILMQFQPSVTDLSGEVFLLTVWSDDPADPGKPGEIIYQDDYFESHTPEYSGSKDGFRYYEFKNFEYLNAEDTSLTVNEVFYVGWQNISSLSLNIGLDWNIDNGDKVFRNTSGEWLPSAFAMSLLIRPVFSTGLDNTLALDADGVQEEITMYPNPTYDAITISGLSGDYELRIFDMSGRMVTSVQNQHQVSVSDLESGLYLVDVRDSAGTPIYASKLIKK
ncbi:MAG: T9SS type A sorting domain-containing protein [Crocinitomix sp.]|nr:T9SS type A sorting domain-containing protein [Crocinitomix sp.]